MGDRNVALTEDSAERKNTPMATGLLDYFPAALAYVATISKYGNDKHNPGEDLHHARGKSMDHPDCIVRHLVDRGKVDDQGIRHSGYVAWRALAELQQELEDAGEATLPRAARLAPATIEVEVPEIVTAARPGLATTQWEVVAERPPRKGERFLGCINESTVYAATHEFYGSRKIVEPARPTGRPEYTVKPVPREQYDPESTDGGW